MSLIYLSKFTGTYDVWLQLGHRYNLTWSTGTEKLNAFSRFFDDSKILDTMLQWLRQAVRELPKPYSDFFPFCTLTELRSSECVNCIKLIKDPCSLWSREGRSVRAATEAGRAGEEAAGADAAVV